MPEHATDYYTNYLIAVITPDPYSIETLLYTLTLSLYLHHYAKWWNRTLDPHVHTQMWPRISDPYYTDGDLPTWLWSSFSAVVELWSGAKVSLTAVLLVSSDWQPGLCGGGAGGVTSGSSKVKKREKRGCECEHRLFSRYLYLQDI